VKSSGMTECRVEQLQFQALKGKRVEGRFDGEKLSSEGGLLLVREVAEGQRFFERLANCFFDRRASDSVKHPVGHLIRQRLYALIAGHEDLNDHDRLRHDPVFQLVCGVVPGEGQLASHSTLGRLEQSEEEKVDSRYKKFGADGKQIEAFLIQEFIRYARRKKLKALTLDVDATDIPLHGSQEDRFFHGYYGHYCYLPLYIFCEDFPLWAELRAANIDASAGTVEALTVIVERLKKALPGVQITIRGDSGFARNAIMNFCETTGISYVFGLARNARLEAKLARAMERVERRHRQTNQPEREFVEFQYRTQDTWSRTRRVIGKAEYLSKGENPRFIVTNLTGDARKLYEQTYCERSDAENRIKEQFQLFAHRTSSSVKRTNQVRLWLSTLAYLLMVLVKKYKLQGTEMENAEPQTLRSKLFKVAVKVSVSVRRVYLSFAEAFPLQDVFRRVVQT
jgi:hypothetical protein